LSGSLTGCFPPYGGERTKRIAPSARAKASSQALTERGAQAPLFIVATARPEFRPPDLEHIAPDASRTLAGIGEWFHVHHPNKTAATIRALAERHKVAYVPHKVEQEAIRQPAKKERWAVVLGRGDRKGDVISRHRSREAAIKAAQAGGANWSIVED